MKPIQESYVVILLSLPAIFGFLDRYKSVIPKFLTVQGLHRSHSLAENPSCPENLTSITSHGMTS